MVSCRSALFSKSRSVIYDSTWWLMTQLPEIIGRIVDNGGIYPLHFGGSQRSSNVAIAPVESGQKTNKSNCLPRKKKRIVLSMKYWLVNRDPYNGL